MRLWACWWIGAIAVPFYQWPAGSETSCFVNWGLLCVIALIIGRDRRQSFDMRLWLGLIFISVLFHLRAIAWTPWTEVWALIAVFGNALIICLLVTEAGSTVLIPKKVKECLPAALLTILSVNLLAWYLIQYHGFAYWEKTFNNGGLFSSTKVWAAWAALSFPLVLKRFGILGVIPLFITLKICASSSAVLALFVMVAWHYQLSWKVMIPLIVTALGVLYWLEGAGTFLDSFSIRIQTWMAAIDTVIQDPAGQGFPPMGLRFKTEMKHMPHPGSDFLELFMRFGWASIVLALFTLKKAFKGLGTDAYSVCLVGAMTLGAVQKSISIPAVGFLVWVLWLCWKEERISDAKS